MNFETMQIELTKIVVWTAIAEGIAFFFAMLMLYIVIKYAIRDGINESKLVRRAWHEGITDPIARDAVRATKEAARVLPPMRAD